MADARVAVEANGQPAPVGDLHSVYQREPSREGWSHPAYGIFQWRIDNFAAVTREGGTILYSPLINDTMHKSIVSGGRTWQLQLVPQVHEATGRVGMSARLYLQDMHFSPVFNMLGQDRRGREAIVPANCRISIVDSEGKALKEAGGPNTPICWFQELSGWACDYLFAIDRVREENLLSNGDLIVKSEIWIRHKAPFNSIYRMSLLGSQWKETFVNYHLANKERLASDLGRLFQQGTLTDDVTVQVGAMKKEFSAIKLVLVASSPVFAAMFTHPSLEHQENRVKIPDFEPPVVEAMLECMYSSKLDPEFLKTNCVDLFRIADKYALEELMDISQEVIAENLSVDNCMIILALADLHQSQWLKKKCLGFIKERPTQVKRSAAYWNVIEQRPDLAAYLSFSSP